MERVELAQGLTREEAAALAYFAMGVSSEGSIGGRNVAYRLSFAGNGLNGEQLRPVGDSGFSIGTLQTDLGQHPAAAGDLTEAYRTWSAAQPGPQPLAPDDEHGWAELERMLARKGHAIDRENGRNFTTETREGINRFLGSKEGTDFVHGRDVRQVEYLLRPATQRNPSALHSITNTDLYRAASDDDQARLLAVFLKIENQSGGSIYPRLIRRINEGSLVDLDAVKEAIEARRDYVSSGVQNTLAGVEAYLQLARSSPENPLAEATTKVLRNPLVSPTSLTAEGDETSPSQAEYHAVRTMFLLPVPAVRFLQSLDSGSGFAHGRIGRGQTGFFVSGNDFAYWDGDGQGHAGIGRDWREVARDDLLRVNHRDGRVDLLQRTAQGEEPLLRIDRAAPPLRPEAGAMLDPSLHDRVRVLHESLGVRADSPALDRITASLMHATTAAGMHRVQHLAVEGGRLFAWDGDPRSPVTRWSTLALEQAERTPVAMSLGAVTRLREAGGQLPSSPSIGVMPQELPAVHARGLG